MQVDINTLASYIDHTLLKPEATVEQIKKVCEEARKYNFASVCENSSHIALAKSQLEGCNVKPICVVGFPLGAMLCEAKAYETKEALRLGAQEIDMVLAIGALKSQDFEFVLRDIKAVTQATHGVPVKVILETALLTKEEKIAACSLTKAGGAQFVKTCTGFNGGAATVEDIQLMRQSVGPDFGVKASGGIKTFDQAKALILAGANRLGTSSGVELVQGKTSAGGY